MKHSLKWTLLLAALSLGASAQSGPIHISLLVTDGEGAATAVHQHVSRDPAVRVEDDDHRPVNGAVVVFSLPLSGPSGEFGSGSKNFNVVTGPDGVAVAHGLRANGIPGKLQIYVTTSYRGLRARTLINQVIEGPPPSPKMTQMRSSSGGKWKWVVLGVVATGAAGGGIYYYESHKSPSVINISSSAVTFGSPR